jgi:bacterial/archaeal transporter family-2 protein
VTVQTLGARGMTACLLAGQLAMAALIDQFGLLGVTQQPLTLARGIGLVLLGAGSRS